MYSHLFCVFLHSDLLKNTIMTVTIYFKCSSMPFQFNLKRSQISKSVDLGLQNPVEHVKYYLNYCKEFSIAPPFFTRSQLIRFNRCIKLYGCVSSLIYHF